MLSYQHEFHAGNHADILKHAALCFILDSLNKKEKPYTIIDLHAGSGIYNLLSVESIKTGEAKKGIEHLMNFCKKTSAQIPECIDSYLKIQGPWLEKNQYAGSPEIIFEKSRKGDAIHLAELHPLALKNLQVNFESKKSNGKIIIHSGDCYETLKKIVPPQIKRGLVLIDPSYEDVSDYAKVLDAVKEIRKKWNTAIIAIWHPLLTRKKNETAKLISELETTAKLGAELCEFSYCTLEILDEKKVSAEGKSSHLYGSGIFVLNAPWKFDEEIKKSSLFLEKILKEF